MRGPDVAAIMVTNPNTLGLFESDIQSLCDAAHEAGLEGIMAKRRDSRYEPGKRTGAWLKVKSRRTMDCVIIGYTEGKGDRASHFGALQIAERAAGCDRILRLEEGRLRPLGEAERREYFDGLGAGATPDPML